MKTAGEYIQELIPPPNIAQPKFTAWVKNNIHALIDAQSVLNGMPQAFTIDNAVGVQLDRIGEILGLPRLLNFEPEAGQSALMEDRIYKIALQAKILMNRWDGTKKQIYDFWRTYFPFYPILIQDGQDMSMTVSVLGIPTEDNPLNYFSYDTEGSGWDEGYWISFTGTLFQDIVRNGYFVPKPAGVKVNYIFPEGRIFGFDIDNQYLGGWDEANWSGV